MVKSQQGDNGNLRRLNQQQVEKHAGTKEFDAVLNSYELACASTPLRIYWIFRKSRAYQNVASGRKRPKILGDDDGETFVQAGVVRTSELRRQHQQPRWGQHSNLTKHAEHAMNTDQPVAGLIQDLKQRGLLEDTLIGGAIIRPHPPQANGGATIPMASNFRCGAGVKPGFSHGRPTSLAIMRFKKSSFDWHATYYTYSDLTMKN